jgi:hypothetical protein
MQVARYRERHATSGAKSDAGDAHALADMVRTDAHQLRPVAGDTALAEGIKVVARAHQSMIWDRTRHVLRLRSALREFFPAALEAFPDLAAADALELLAAAPDPLAAAALSRSHVAGALRRARRRDVAGKAEHIQAVLRAQALGQSAVLAGAYAVTVRSTVAVITVLNSEIAALQGQVEAYFGRHPDVEIYRSHPRARRDPRRPGARRVRRRPPPLPRRTSSQELRRHLPDHPRLRQEENRAGPLRPQATALPTLWTSRHSAH